VSAARAFKRPQHHYSMAAKLVGGMLITSSGLNVYLHAVVMQFSSVSLAVPNAQPNYSVRTYLTIEQYRGKTQHICLGPEPALPLVPLRALALFDVSSKADARRFTPRRLGPWLLWCPTVSLVILLESLGLLQALCTWLPHRNRPGGARECLDVSVS
jgi:hypothetical protein